jgi:CRISPR-associated protein Cmr4
VAYPIPEVAPETKKIFSCGDGKTLSDDEKAYCKATVWNSLVCIANNKGKIVLEEYSLTLTNNHVTKTFADKLNAVLGLDDLKNRLIVLSNDEFTDFVKMHTELITRIRIGAGGTADGGALFNEEYLPTESVMYSLVMASRIFKKEGADKGIFAENGSAQKDHEKLMDYFKQGLNNKVFQLGGNATLGKGLIKSITSLI